MIFLKNIQDFFKCLIKIDEIQNRFQKISQFYCIQKTELLTFQSREKLLKTLSNSC